MDRKQCAVFLVMVQGSVGWFSAKILALFHMEDQTLPSRKELYAKDVKKSGFAGEVIVPVDLDQLDF